MHTTKEDGSLIDLEFIMGELQIANPDLALKKLQPALIQLGYKIFKISKHGGKHFLYCTS